MNLAQNAVHVGEGLETSDLVEVYKKCNLWLTSSASLRHLSAKLYVDGLLSHQKVGGTENRFVRLTMCIQIIRVVGVFVGTEEPLLQEHINNGDLGYIG